MPTASITISGIPCEVTFDIHPAEPDIGIPRSYIEEFIIESINGRRVRKPSHARWLQAKLNDRATFDRAVEDALTDYHNQKDYW